MADESFTDGRASEEPYTRVRTLGRGAFGEAVLYRKTEVGKWEVKVCVLPQQASLHRSRQSVRTLSILQILSLSSGIYSRKVLKYFLRCWISNIFLFVANLFDSYRDHLPK